MVNYRHREHGAAMQEIKPQPMLRTKNLLSVENLLNVAFYSMS